MAKNIVVLSDGTGQIGGKGHDTNIYKMFRMLEDRTDRQIVFYDEGLGTDWRILSGNAFGAGLSKNLLQCYRFIHTHYQAGDRIYLFGFSRGAATVRSLASFIHYFGILPRSRPGLIAEAYTIYRKGQEKLGSALAENLFEFSRERADDLRQQARKILRRNSTEGSTTEGDSEDDSEDLDDREEELNRRAIRFVHEHPNQWANIEFLGVWDTVPAIGVVALAGLNSFLGRLLKYNFHNFKLHPSIKNAYHALAIDDERAWFHPSVWTEKTRDDQIVEQVWFSGAHTDIGGGFAEAGLSDITLEWMMEKAVSHGLHIYLGSRKYWNFVIAPDATDRDHDPRAGIGRIYKKEVRDQVWFKQGGDTTAASTFGPPIIHESVIRRLQGNGSKSTPWYLTKNPSADPEFAQAFDDFLHRKFHEHLQFEWRKFTAWEDPSLRFRDWLRKKCSEYQGDLPLNKGKVDTTRLTREWLQQEFEEWRKKHTFTYLNQEYFAEPYQKLEDVSGPEALKMEIKNNVGAAPGSLRDYDSDAIADDPVSTLIKTAHRKGRTRLLRRWEVIKLEIEAAVMEEINSSRNNLVRRGSSERRDRLDRLGYDFERRSAKK